MSLCGTNGTSLVEVMVMMVILGISIVGIYSMVDRGRELANLTNTRLSAVNIAREGLESVTTLRDTFALNGYESGTCSTPSSVDAFMSIDGHILLEDNCPRVITVNPITYYILSDTRTLKVDATNYNVCMNEYGWYSQEYSVKNGSAPEDCAPGNKCPCSMTSNWCEENTTKSCKTSFKRKISFKSCTDPAVSTEYCLQVTSKVWWSDTEPTNDDSTESLTLSQIIAPLD